MNLKATVLCVTGALTLPTLASSAEAERIRIFESSLRPSSEVVGPTGRLWTLDERMAFHKVPGLSLAVIRDGKLAWAKGYGVLQAGKVAKVDARTLFSVGSVSKVATAAITLRLVDAGIVDLDRNVNDYLERWRVPDNVYTAIHPVTLRGILSHTAGLTVHGFPDFLPDAPLPSVIDTLEGRAPAKNEPVRVISVPGAQFDYSGGGTTIEQLLIEEVTGKPFAQAARAYVFAPLGMARSTYENPLPERYGNIAKAHGTDGSPRALPRGYETMPEMGASGLWTTPREYARLLMAIMESSRDRPHSFLSHAIAGQMLTEVGRSGAGLGPFLDGEGADRRFSHAGSNDSYKAWIEGHPATGDGVVIFTNGANGAALCQEVRRSVAIAEGWTPALTRPVSASGPRITASHYANAEKWIKANALARLKNLFVRPQWIEGEGHRFWYRRETARGHEITVVDAESAQKASAFDHAALAKELERLAGRPVDGSRLDLVGLTLSAKLSRIEFSFGDRPYRCLATPVVRCEPRKASEARAGVLVSPDGRWGVRTREANLELIELQGRKRRALTRDGQPHFGYGLYYGNWEASFIPNARVGKPLVPMGAQWSPGSKYLLVSRLDERHVAEYPFIESSPADGSFRPKVHAPRIPLTGEAPASLDWFVIEIATGRKVRLALPYEKLMYLHQDWTALAATWWDETAGRLYAVAHGENRASAFFFEISLASGAARTVLEEHMSPRMDLSSSPYDAPNVRWLGRTGELIWFSQRSGWGHLYLYDARSGALEHPITHGDWLVRDILGVDEQRRVLYFSASGKEGKDPYRRQIYRVSLEGGEPERLTPEDADHPIASGSEDEEYAALSPDGRYLLYNYSRIDQPTRTAVVSTSGGAPKIVEAADASALYAAGWRDPQPFTVKAADGVTDLYGVLYLPAGLDPSRLKSYPIIDHEYASPLTAVAPHDFATAIQGPSNRTEPASLAELGFAVVVLDARGTAFRSKAFSHWSDGNLNTVGLEDHIAAIRELARRHPWMDPDRVGIDGASYGGFAVFRAMFEFPEFFKVGVSAVGMGSFSGMYPDSHWEAYHGRVRYANGSVLKSSPQDRPVNYLDNDNSIQAKNLKGRLLVTVAELDENVLPGSTLQVVDALIRADRDFEMYYFPGEPHRFRNAFSTRRTWDYLVEHLQGQIPPTYHLESGR